MNVRDVDAFEQNPPDVVLAKQEFTEVWKQWNRAHIDARAVDPSLRNMREEAIC